MYLFLYNINSIHFQVIRNVRPDIVMVELCPSRIHILKHDEKTLLEEAKNFNMAKVIFIIQSFLL